LFYRGNKDETQEETGEYGPLAKSLFFFFYPPYGVTSTNDSAQCSKIRPIQWLQLRRFRKRLTFFFTIETSYKLL
jgi:hypothetical protein